MCIRVCASMHAHMHKQREREREREWRGREGGGEKERDRERFAHCNILFLYQLVEPLILIRTMVGEKY